MSAQRDELIAILESHEYAGNGKCVCGEAIGTSDGTVWTCDPSGHLANVLIREGWIKDVY